MRKILLASSNSNKINEIKTLLKERNIEVLSLLDLNYTKEIEETGSTFEENAYIKAHTLMKEYHVDVLADDSGLEVDALYGMPGVHSKRFSASGKDTDNNQLLLDKLQSNPNRDAHFRSVICFVEKNGETYYFEGQVNGIILDQYRGSNGFGYDPLFFIPSLNKTMAELSLDEKNQISHRAKAMHSFISFLKEKKL